MLAETEAFGLPGAIATKVAFQRRDQGHPLDDIVLTAQGVDGQAHTLEIQVKRSCVFTKSNGTFGKIVADMVASYKLDPTCRFAVAIERISLSIENGVQEALELARHTSDEASFRKLLAIPGRHNQPMRDFVAAFEYHLSAAGADAAIVAYQLLRRLSVLRFDYARPNSIAEQADRWRAARLTSGQTDSYGEFIKIIMRTDSIGGDLDRNRLLELLAEENVSVSAAPSLAHAREKIAERSSFALADIDTTIAGAHILRSTIRQVLEKSLEAARETSGVFEISGSGGVGKSALLKVCATARIEHGPILVLAPDRITPGGWNAFQNQLGLNVDAERFLRDLASDGGGEIFIDGLDRFRSEAERKTVSDIILTAAPISGLTVAFTARPGWLAANQFSDAVIDALKDRDMLKIDGLDDDEATSLAQVVPALSAILAPDHPAKDLARNPFILKRFIAAKLVSDTLVSEAALADGWWRSGGHAASDDAGAQRSRRRILLAVVRDQLDGATVVDLRPEAADSTAVSTLIDDGILIELATDRVKFKHDLFSDWAIVAYLSEDPHRILSLASEGPPAFWLERGSELAFRQLAEQDDPLPWSGIIKKLQFASAHQGWLGLALIALVRSEQPSILLKRHKAMLLTEEGDLAERLMRRVMGAHSIEVELPLSTGSGNGSPTISAVAIPDVKYWMSLIRWLAKHFADLPSKALHGAVEMMHKWISAFASMDMLITPILLDRLADLLVAHVENHALQYIPVERPVPKPRYSASRDTVDTARMTLAFFADKNPNAAKRYLDSIAASERAVDELCKNLESAYALPKAAPGAFAAALLEGMRQEYERCSDGDRMRASSFSLSRLEHPFLLSKCGLTLFLDLLNADADEGIALIRTLTKMTENVTQFGGSFELELQGANRTIQSSNSYLWSRGYGLSRLVGKALTELEYWAHREIETGAEINEVAMRIAGDGPISGALLLVVVDLVLCHPTSSGSLLHDLLASPELLAIDFRRYQHDCWEASPSGSLGRLQAGSPSDRSREQDLAAHKSRQIGLHCMFGRVAQRVSPEDLSSFKARLTANVERLGAWSETKADWRNPIFMASYARNAIEREHSHKDTQNLDGVERKDCVYDYPADQTAWMAKNEAKDIKASIEDAEMILAETTNAGPPTNDTLDHESRDTWLMRLSTAVFLAQQYSVEQLRREAPKLRGIFDQELNPETSARLNLDYGMLIDPTALAFAGLIYLYRDNETKPSIEDLLKAIAKNNPSTILALHQHAEAAKALGVKKLKACIRTGMQSCLVSRRHWYDVTEDKINKREQALQQKIDAHIRAEREWLAGNSGEPDWIIPPPARHRLKRRGIILPSDVAAPVSAANYFEYPDFHFDDNTGEKWIRALQIFGMPGDLEAMFLSNREWLLHTNSTEEDDDAGAPDVDKYWTTPLFECAAQIAPNWSEAQREEYIFSLLDQFASYTFFSTTAAFLLASDIQHIQSRSQNTEYLAQIRTRIWTSLKAQQEWKRHKWSRDGGLEIHLNDLVSALFMRQPIGLGDRLYAAKFNEVQLIAFIETLTQLAVDAGPCPSIPTLYLDVVELLPAELACVHLLKAAAEWVVHAEDGFWRAAGIGQRVAKIAQLGISSAQSADGWEKIASAIEASGIPAGNALRTKIKSLIHPGSGKN